MPPAGSTPVTVSDHLAMKLTRIPSQHDCSSYAEAIEYAADTTLLQAEEPTILEVIQFSLNEPMRSTNPLDST